MEQHPIPQNVSSYQFKLVGDMTLKQFFQLAGGVLIGIIFYSSPLIGIIKWPFAITSVILGVALAFMPLEERPLERWIFAFFRAIYTPTMFFWKKTTAPAKIFQDEATGPAPTTGSSEQEAALKNYLATSRQPNGPWVKLDGAERGFLAALSGIFAGLKGPVSTTVPTTSPQGVPAEAKTQMDIPVTMPIKIVQPGVPHLVVEEKPKAPSPEGHQATAQQVAPIIAGDEIVSTKQAIFSVDAAPPNPPTVPNTVVGQVVDENKRIIEGAIMEIRDEAGRPVRALRSNKLGHFMTVTPLDSGRYDIVTDKEGYQFVPITFDATGTLIPPILVEGRSLVMNQEAGIINQGIGSVNNEARIMGQTINQTYGTTVTQ